MEDWPKPEEKSIPVYVEFGLTALAAVPHLISMVYAYAQRVALEHPHFQGEAKISFLRDEKKGSLIKLVWCSEAGYIFKQNYIRWPSGDILCPCCLGNGVFKWDNGVVMHCRFCDGTGVSGSVSLEPEFEDD